MKDKLYDSYGTEINVGDYIEESFWYSYPKGHNKYPNGYTFSTEIYTGIVQYEKGCHILNFKPLNKGRLGVYTFHDRWPFCIDMGEDMEHVVYKSLWKVVK